jgi:hypothetical protein
MTASLEQKLVAGECRLRGMQAEAESLLVKLQHLQQASQAEITKARTVLEELGSQTVQFALEDVNEKLEAEGERALSEFRNRSGQIVESEFHALSQRVSSAGDVVRDWSEQASEALAAKAAASAESLQKQSEQVAAGFTDKLQNDADEVMSEVLERVQQTARLLEGTTVAAVQAGIQKGTQELVDTMATQLRQLGQSTMALVSEQLAETQKRFTTEMSESLHRNFDELMDDTALWPAGRAPVGAYFAVDIRAGGEQQKTVTVYLRKNADEVQVVGIDRTW